MRPAGPAADEHNMSLVPQLSDYEDDSCRSSRILPSLTKYHRSVHRQHCHHYAASHANRIRNILSACLEAFIKSINIYPGLLIP